jgi:two-component system, NarL family, response regulator LiaR
MSSQAKIRVLIVDDHPLMREALCTAIEDEADLEIAGEASNGVEGVQQARVLKPDVIVMDLYMPLKDGVETITEIRAENPAARILVLTSSSEEGKLMAAVQAGALGYLLKDSSRTVLLQGIRDVAQGQAFLPPHLALKLMDAMRQQGALPPVEAAPIEALTDRELDVLKWIGRGASNREIAAALVLADGTVRTHVHHILGKLGLENRNQAILYAIRTGLVEKTKA